MPSTGSRHASSLRARASANPTARSSPSAATRSLPPGRCFSRRCFAPSARAGRYSRTHPRASGRRRAAWPVAPQSRSARGVSWPPCRQVTASGRYPRRHPSAACRHGRPGGAPVRRSCCTREPQRRANSPSHGTVCRGATAGQPKKKAASRRPTGGGTGIRTPEGLLTLTRFPGVRLQPLIHPSEGPYCIAAADAVRCGSPQEPPPRPSARRLPGAAGGAGNKKARDDARARSSAAASRAAAARTVRPPAGSDSGRSRPCPASPWRAPA
jgi:hypothetical protein